MNKEQGQVITKIEREDIDCNICFWGEERRHTHYENGKPVSFEDVYDCTQDSRPKPCQRGLFMSKA